MLPLFAYGTLRDPDYQRELFGRTYYMHRARISGLVVYTTATGYLAATPGDGAIDGALVDIDAAGLAIADAWEDLDVYDRIEGDAVPRDGGSERCYVYVAAAAFAAALDITAAGSDGQLAKSRAEVIADIRRFRAALILPEP